MRTGSVILSVIGACLAILLALLVALGGTFLMPIVNEALDTNYDKDYDELGYDKEFDEDMTNIAKGVLNTFFTIFAGMLLVSGVLALIAAFTINKNNTTSGILLIIGFILSLLTVIGLLPAILMLLGGIFALVKSKDEKKIVDEPKRVNAFGEEI